MLKNLIIVPVGVLASSLLALQTGTAANQPAQVPSAAAHEHLTEVACVDVPAGETRPEFGCFNVGTITGLEIHPTERFLASAHVRRRRYDCRTEYSHGIERDRYGAATRIRLGHP